MAAYRNLCDRQLDLQSLVERFQFKQFRYEGSSRVVSHEPLRTIKKFLFLSYVTGVITVIPSVSFLLDKRKISPSIHAYEREIER